MGVISGLELKKNGIELCRNTRQALVQWRESNDPRQRTFYFLVKLRGNRYTQPLKVLKNDIESIKMTIGINK